ncbi:Nucleoside diphosphate-linked moiety X motif 8 [Anabarilius grahami]|uniref:Nucleoside diphosphate-linked moiety X motif 8 n=1 Tax=Anabarilius grahami TaxID=495550 RepID=A0A3N0YNA4_ANAGA|nr:Nucleoside diphosphate-linked moiety X motif 8 [Anabarilius grahami]
MLRTARVKTCVDQLRFHRLELMLRDAHMVCRSSSVLPDQHCSRRSASSGVPGVLNTSEHVCSRAVRRTCSSSHLLLAHVSLSSISWAHAPKTSSLFLHSSLSGSPSQCRRKCLLRRSPLENSPSCPESRTKRQTCVFRRSTDSAGVSQRAAGRSAVLTGQTHTRSATDECLSAGNEARCRRSLQANAALYERSGKSWAAVLVCLCAVSGRPALLFTLRSAQLKGRHKGDVSFAGGKKDPSDRSVVDTALREAGEELGIRVTEDQVWGVMKPLRDMSGMMIAPVIANLGPLETLCFRPNPSEVEEVFSLTLEHLCQAQNRGYTHFRTGDRFGYTLPVFHGPRYRVWGLTAVALDQALALIVPHHGSVSTEAAC